MKPPPDNRWMDEAIRLARQNVDGRAGGPFGAVIVKEGRRIATGANAVTTVNDPTAHAEIVAIRGACRQLGTFSLEGCDLYTSCEPCPMCLGAIYWARLDRVFFAATREEAAAAGFDDALIYEEFALRPGDRRIPMERMAGERSRIPFEAWKASISRVVY
jgi:guanine deaminase